MFEWIWIQYTAYYQTAENCFSMFYNFSVMDDQKWENTEKRHFVGFAQKF